MMDLGALSGVEANASGSCIANAAACLCTAKHLLRMIDAPDAVGHWHGAMDFHERPFACFKGAYAIAKKTTKTTRADDNEEDALVNMSQAMRLGLKRALHEDVRGILKTASDEARAPKSLNGVALPTDPTECLQSVDALALKTEAQVAALADDIAYNHHDLDDGLRARLFTLEDVAGLERGTRITLELKALPADDEEAQDFADAGLLRAKAAGRDRIVVGTRTDAAELAARRAA